MTRAGAPASGRWLNEFAGVGATGDHEDVGGVVLGFATIVAVIGVGALIAHLGVVALTIGVVRLLG